ARTARTTVVGADPGGHGLSGGGTRARPATPFRVRGGAALRSEPSRAALPAARGERLPGQRVRSALLRGLPRATSLYAPRRGEPAPPPEGGNRIQYGGDRRFPGELAACAPRPQCHGARSLHGTLVRAAGARRADPNLSAWRSAPLLPRKQP